MTVNKSFYQQNESDKCQKNVVLLSVRKDRREKKLPIERYKRYEGYQKKDNKDKRESTDRKYNNINGTQSDKVPVLFPLKPTHYLQK